jgi:hypothetical protein
MATQNTKATKTTIKVYSTKPWPSSSTQRRLKSSIVTSPPFGQIAKSVAAKIRLTSDAQALCRLYQRTNRAIYDSRGAIFSGGLCRAAKSGIAIYKNENRKPRGPSANPLFGTITFCNPRELPLIQVRARTKSFAQGFHRRGGNALLEKIAHTDVRDTVEFVYHSAWKSGEAMALQWSWIDGDMIRLPAAVA